LTIRFSIYAEARWFASVIIINEISMLDRLITHIAKHWANKVGLPMTEATKTREGEERLRRGGVAGFGAALREPTFGYPREGSK
jgi:hypothetical protein